MSDSDIVTISLTIDAAEAVRGFRPVEPTREEFPLTQGRIDVPVTPELLGDLNEQDREDLAKHIGQANGWAPRLTDNAAPLGHYPTAADISRLLEERRRYIAHRDDAARSVWGDAALAEKMEEPIETRKVRLYFDCDGNICEVCCDRDTLVTATVPVVPSDHWVDGNRYASEEIIAKYKARQAAVREQRKAAIEALRPRMEAAKTRREAAKLAEQAEYDRLYARIPKELRERNEAGYCEPGEVIQALSRVAFEDDLEIHDDRIRYEWPDGEYETISTLTPERFRRLQAFKEQLPKEAGIKTYQFWTGDVAEEDKCAWVKARWRLTREDFIEVWAPLD